MQSLLRDVRYGIRSLIKSPGAHDRRDPRADPRHRPHDDDVQHRLRRADEGAALPRRRSHHRRRSGRMPARGINGSDIPIQDYFDFKKSAALVQRPRRGNVGHDLRQRRREGRALRRLVDHRQHVRRASASARCSAETSAPAKTRRRARRSRSSPTRRGRNATTATRTSSARRIRVNGVPTVDRRRDGRKDSRFRTTTRSGCRCRPIRSRRRAARDSSSRCSASSSPACRSIRRASTSRRSPKRLATAYQGIERRLHDEPSSRSSTTTSARSRVSCSDDDARRGVLRAAHRVRERREPAARSRGAPDQGSRHSHRARRVALGGRAAVSRRGARRCRSSATVLGIVVAHFGIDLFNRAIADAVDSVLHRHSPASAGARCSRSPIAALTTLHLRRDSGDPVVARRHQRDPEGRIARRVELPHRQDQQGARRCSRSRCRADCSSRPA